MMSATGLLAGPRGRRLCLEFAQRWWDVESDALSELRQAVGYASHAMTTNPGTMFTLSSFEPVAPAAAPEIPTVTASEVALFLDATGVAEPTVATLTLALGTAVGNARYWEDPDRYSAGSGGAPAFRRGDRAGPSHRVVVRSGRPHGPMGGHVRFVGECHQQRNDARP
jgi:hypothetical protein